MVLGGCNNNDWFVGFAMVETCHDNLSEATVSWKGQCQCSYRDFLDEGQQVETVSRARVECEMAMNRTSCK